jgi:hypothetical protein
LITRWESSRFEPSEICSKLKFKVDTTGNDWLRIGNFDR